MQTQEMKDAVERTRVALIGLPRMLGYFESLFANLPNWTVRHGLDIQETEELMLWVCTVMENPLPNTSQVQQMLMSGYADLSWTTHKSPVLDDFILVMLEAKDSVTKAYWEKTPRGKKRLVTQRKGRKVTT